MVVQGSQIDQAERPGRQGNPALLAELRHIVRREHQLLDAWPYDEGHRPVPPTEVHAREPDCSGGAGLASPTPITTFAIAHEKERRDEVEADSSRS